MPAFQRSERTQTDQAALRRVELPLLVVVGERDEVLESARQLATEVPGAELVTLARENHQSALAAQACKHAAGRFLQARPSAEEKS